MPVLECTYTRCGFSTCERQRVDAADGDICASAGIWLASKRRVTAADALAMLQEISEVKARQDGIESELMNTQTLGTPHQDLSKCDLICVSFEF